MTDGYSTVPVGTIVAIYCSANNPPLGWLLCDGGTFLESDYGDLWKLLHGQLPDLRRRVIIGAADGAYAQGSSVGAPEVKLANENMPSHQHYGMGADSQDDWIFGTSTAQKFADQVSYRGAEQTDLTNYLYGSTWAGGAGKNDIDVTQGSPAGKTSSGWTDNVAFSIVQPSLAVNYFIYAGKKTSNV